MQTSLLLNWCVTHIQGISAAPTDLLDLFHWTAKIEGLSGTIWEGTLSDYKLYPSPAQFRFLE